MDASRADEIEAHFCFFANCFGSVHASVISLLLYSTSVFSERCGSLGNGLLFSATLASSMFLSVPAQALLGTRNALAVSFVLNTLYCFLFASAVLMKAAEPGGLAQQSCRDLEPVLFLTGSVLAGLGAGIMWSAQGVYFAHASKLASRDSADEEMQRSRFAGMFAVRFLAWELVLKLLTSVLQVAGVGIGTALGFSCPLAAAASAVWMLRESLLREERTPPSTEQSGVLELSLGRVMNVVALWAAPETWLLAPINIAFGFGSAYLNGPFNARIAKAEMSTRYIGGLGALTVLMAALSSKAYSHLAQSHGKGLPLALGSLAFLVASSIASTGCHGWGLWIAFVFVMFGMGRGYYESVNRALVADVFARRDVNSAFANVTIQQAASTALAYFIDTPTVYVATCMVAATLAYPFYRLALRSEKEESAPLAQGARGPGTSASSC